MIVILFWLALSIAVGMFASIRRNRSGIGWFILAVLISPLLAIVFVAILKPKDDVLRLAFDELPRSERERLARLRRDLDAR